MDRRVLLTVFLVGCNCDDGSGIQTLAPTIRATPNPLQLGTVFAGSAIREPVYVENIGSVALSVSSVKLADGAYAGLSVSDAAFDLAPAAGRDVEVSLVVRELGPISGTLLIASNDPGRPVLEVPITATGARRPGPVIEVCVTGAGCVDPLRAAFGAVAFGASRTATITIANRGDQPLAIASAMALAGAHPSFSFTPPSTATSLAPDATISVLARFAPTEVAEVSAVFQIVSNDAAREIVPIVFTGGGVAPGLCPSLPAIDFGIVPIGQSADRSLRLESCGAVAVQLAALELTGSAAEYTIVNRPTLPAELAPGAAIELLLRYAPANPGRDDAQLRVGSNLPDGFIALTGAASSCDLQVAPLVVDFGAVARGQSRTRAVLVENVGAADCELTRIALGMGTTAELAVNVGATLPLRLAPGAGQPVDVVYTPNDAGNDSGTLEIEGSDPAEPRIVVMLAGRRLAIGECQLTAMPDPIQLGAVALGMRRTVGVMIRNDGTALCTLTQLQLEASSSRDLVISTPTTFPHPLLSGRTVSVDVSFEPRRVGQAMGTLELFSINPLRPSLTIPITASGSGPQLCASPNPVVFGTHQIGAVIARSVNLVACGTEASVITGLTLPAPTSSEYSIATQPGLPLTVAAGAMIPVDLRYVGADAGRDDGILRVASNDGVTPNLDVRLVGASSNGPCGDVQGKICGLGPNAGPVAGARVYVDAGGMRVETTTDQNGDFILSCVPVGTWMVNAESGQWSTRFPATVSAYSVTSIPGQQCLDPSSARVAVVWGEWDQMQGILQTLGIPFTLYGDSGQPETRLLHDPAEMARYDIIFLNCGFNEGLVLSGQGLANVRGYVANGGSLYASDWAYDVLEIAWPNAVDYFRDDAIPNDAQSAGNFSGLVDVVDSQLRMQLGGRPQVQISSCCTAIDTAGMGTSVFLEGDRLRDGGRHPLMLGFTPSMGAGRVYYTDFHNTGQPDINDIFRWLITRL